MSEAELIAGCLKEDRTAQQALYEQFAPKMLGVCFRYVRNQEEAEDVMQEGFIKVFNHIGAFRKESSLATWISRIMVNTALSYIKSQVRFRNESDIADIPETEIQLAAYQLHQMDAALLMRCINGLPDGYRIVLNLFAIEGYSHKEIAERLGINESTSRSQFARAKQLLEKQLTILTGERPRQYAGK